jgi:YegS/Rv2252/BmrU family lipid kinase
MDDVCKALTAAGWRVSTRLVTRKAALRRRTRAALRKEARLVVVVGGDGAVGQVVTAMVGSDAALGVIPTGTGNLFAANLGLPTDRGAAIATLLDGRPRRIDIGRARIDGKERAFTIACGIGYDAEVMEDTPRERKVRWGQLAYLASAVSQAAALEAAPYTLTIDGERVKLEAAQIFVANVGRMLPLVEPRLPVVPDDGRLDVIALTASGRLPAALAGWEALRQDEPGTTASGRVFRARARSVRVEAKSPRLVEMDGSAAGTTPLDVEVVPGGLCVVVPAS